MEAILSAAIGPSTGLLSRYRGHSAAQNRECCAAAIRNCMTVDEADEPRCFAPGLRLDYARSQEHPMHRAVITLAFALICATDAPAAEVKILTAGAMKAVVLELVPQFEKETGHKAVVDNDTAGGLAKRIEGSEVFDLAVVTPGVLNDLAKKGKVVGDSRANVGRGGVGG